MKKVKKKTVKKKTVKKKHTKIKRMTDKEIELFCQGVENVLTKISDRADSIKSKKKYKKN